MIHIIGHKLTARLNYVLDFIFKDVLKVDYAFHTHTENVNYPAPKIYYLSQNEGNEFFIPDSGILAEVGINRKAFQKMESLCDHWLQNNSKPTYPETDIFALIFMCLSRYEEYLPHIKDKYGRFPAQESIAYKKDFLQRAIVDECIEQLAGMIKSLNTGFEFPYREKYYFTSTIDIDQAWCYAHKGFRNLAGAFRDMAFLKIKGLHKRILSAWVHDSNDPFNTYSLIIKMHLKENINPLFFFLVSHKTNDIDKSHSPDNKYFRSLITFINNLYEVGIHPSFLSNSSRLKLKEELDTLQEITGQAPKISRQHFVILNLPNTYDALIEAGIIADFSMGYPETMGYRASTGHAFFWYDLIKEEVSLLRVYPFQLMDVTLKNYLKYAPDEAIINVESLIKYAVRINSPLCMIWHNSSLDEEGDWSGWTRVYAHILNAAKGKQ